MSDSRNPPERRLPVLRQQGWEHQRSTVEGTFALGHLYATPGALQAMLAAGDDLFAYLARHARGDWGEVGEEDWLLNDRALVGGTRLLSAYRLSDGTKTWIITEAGRSVTTVMLPEEY
jgi:hypothetical protein